MFFQAHSHIRDVDGLHADAALDELCKLMLATLHENRQPATPAAIRRIYERVAASAGVPCEPIRLSDAAVATVMRTLAAYDFSATDADVKGRAFQRVLTPATRAGMGQYFTPHEVVDGMVAIAAPGGGELVLDPFAGSAHLLRRSRERVDGGRFVGIEKNERMVRVAQTDLRLRGTTGLQLLCADALADFSELPGLEPESFDLILTNPPFGSLLGRGAMSRLARFDLAQSKQSVPLEVLGLERCVEFLKPGGRLGIVLPDGVLANAGTQPVRRWFTQRMKLRAIVSLPVATFVPFGANIKTSLVFARKWRADEPRDTAAPVCLARVDDAAELNSAVGHVTSFLRVKGW